MIRRGDIWWADFGEPGGSEPGYRRPVVIVQSDWASKTRIRTVTVVPLTSNTIHEAFPGNVLLQPRDSGLPRQSVANVPQVTTLDQRQLQQRVGSLPTSLVRLIDDGIRLFLDL